MRFAWAVGPSTSHPSVSQLATMKSVALCLLATLGLAVPAAANGVTIELSQPVFEIGVPGDALITGTPGDLPFLLHSPDPGPTMLPFVGLVDVGPTNLKIVSLPPIPASGSQTFTCFFACSPTLVQMQVYTQVVAVNPNPFSFCKSEQVVVEFSDGDCSTICSGGVQQLGLQLEICNPPSLQGHVLVEVRDGASVVGLSLFTPIDLNNPPALPQTMNGVTLEKVEFDAVANCITIRFCIDSVALGLGQLPANTTVMTDWMSCDMEATLPCDCTLPIAVGDEFGPYTVTKLIDLF